MHQTHNLRVVDTVTLPTPAQIRKEIPLSEPGSVTVHEGRRDVRRILQGLDPRLLVIVGPCSIHDPEAALEYAHRLLEARQRFSDTLLLVMRVYFEKPRTRTGWKGLINDPHLDGSNAIPTGLRLGRRLMNDLVELGLPIATELLDPITPQYLADLVTWAAIGARTTESQTHREMASGLSMPIGFKNGTDGNLDIAENAMIAAASPHSFLGIDDLGRVGVVHTKGNPDTHIVLRGSNRGPNYQSEFVASAAERLRKANLNPRLLVDCSHGNSGKDAERQPLVLNDVAQQLTSRSSPIFGVMIESNLVRGAQPLKPKSELKYGQSITDACVDFETTLSMLQRLAGAATSRRHPPLQLDARPPNAISSPVS